MSIFISPSLLSKLEWLHGPAFTTTQYLNGQVMISAKENQKASLLSHNYGQLKPVNKSEVLVATMTTCDQILGLPRFNGMNVDIDWTKGLLGALRKPNGPQWAKIPEADGTSFLLIRDEERTNYKTPLDIQLLGSTAFGHS
jgi:hypothetical protein